MDGSLSSRTRMTPATPASYIHAKVITVTPANGTATGFMGSENFSDPSMKYNRELGVMLDSTTDSQVLNTLQNAFDKDFSSTTLTTQLTPTNPQNIPRPG